MILNNFRENKFLSLFRQIKLCILYFIEDSNLTISIFFRTRTIGNYDLLKLYQLFMLSNSFKPKDCQLKLVLWIYIIFWRNGTVGFWHHFLPLKSCKLLLFTFDPAKSKTITENEPLLEIMIFYNFTNLSSIDIIDWRNGTVGFWPQFLPLESCKLILFTFGPANGNTITENEPD